MESTRFPDSFCIQCGEPLAPGARYCRACGSACPPGSSKASAPHGATKKAHVYSLRQGESIGILNRYWVVKPLAYGGFGEVYLVDDANLKRRCVAKLLVKQTRASAAQWTQLCHIFRREAELLARLNTPGHPNIPEIYEYLGDQNCLTMKYIEGQSLEGVLIKRAAPLDETDALRYVRAVCSALVYMHSQAPKPVLHRDVKPSNIICDSAGHIWLIDFGLAKAPSPSLETVSKNASLTGGTPGFTPPEQWRGKAVPRSDVYALSATLYNLVTGALPPQALLGVPPETLSFPKSVSPSVVQLVRRGMAQAVADRPDAFELLGQLDALLNPTLPPPLDFVPPPEPVRFIGRVAEQAHLRALLAEGGIAVVTGMPGVGKSALIATLARQLKPVSKIFWQTFLEQETNDTVLGRLASFLARHGRERGHQLLYTSVHGARPMPVQRVIDYMVQDLAGGDFLICFDDLQWLKQDQQSRYLVAQLVAAAQSGQTQLLVTSRSTPTRLPPSALLSLGGLHSDDVATLLAATKVRLPDEIAAELLRVTGGNAQLLYLAIDLLRVAADPATLITSLATTRNIHDYLMNQVDKGLNKQERLAMEAVAVLLGLPGTASALEVISGGRVAPRLLNELSHRSLLQISGEGSGTLLYSEHALLRDYFYQNLSGSQRKRLHQRAGAHYSLEEQELLRAALHYEQAQEFDRAATLVSANASKLINKGQAQAVERLLARLPAKQYAPTLAVAVEVARGEAASMLGNYAHARERLTVALAQVSWHERHVGDERRGGGDLVQLAEYGARGFRLLALIEERTGRYEQAEQACRQGMALESTLGEQHPELAQLHNQLAEVLWRWRRLPEIEQVCREGLDRLPPGLSAYAARAALEQRLAMVEGVRGNSDKAISGLEQSLELARSAENPALTALILNNLGYSVQLRGEHEWALHCLRESLQIKEQIGDLAGQATTMLNIGLLHQERGENERAAQCFEEVRTTAQRYGLAELEARATANLGILRFDQGDLLGAEARLSQALEMHTHLDNASGRVDCLYRLGELALARDDAPRAQQYGEQALTLAHKIGEGAYTSCALRVCGEAQHRQGRLTESAQLLAQAWDIQQDVDDPYDKILILIARARLARSEGDRDRAVALATKGLDLARTWQFAPQGVLLEQLLAELKL